MERKRSSILKVSRSQKKIVMLKLIPKNERTNLFCYSKIPEIFSITMTLEKLWKWVHFILGFAPDRSKLLQEETLQPYFVYSQFPLCGKGKVINPKYSKHWPYNVANPIDCVCSKMLNRTLNHGLKTLLLCTLLLNSKIYRGNLLLIL